MNVSGTRAPDHAAIFSGNISILRLDVSVYYPWLLHINVGKAADGENVIIQIDE